jgi:hypothetical protein
MASDAITRRPLQGLIQIVGSWQDVERAQEDVRRELEACLVRTARLIKGDLARPAKRRRPGRP